MIHMTSTTAPISTRYRTNDHLAAFQTEAYSVDGNGDAFTVSFTDADAAIEAVEQAKLATVANYIRGGGNPRNRRAFGVQFAAVKRAIEAAR